tara:strand:+ start:1266 stop:1787 length:522 start_codon:yes stop_codon:yes gene_type:complete
MFEKTRNIMPACFLDRDGVINIEKGYLFNEKDFEWIEGAIDAIRYISDKGYLIIVVTNQSGIARGYYTENDVYKLHQFINSELKKNGTKIDDFFFSPYHPDFKDKFIELSHLRKPNTGMLKMAFEKWKFDKSKSFMIGDQDTDIKCAQNFGIRGYLYKSGNLLDFIKQSKIII